MYQGEIPLIKYCTEEYLQRGRIIFYNKLLKYEVFFAHWDRISDANT